MDFDLLWLAAKLGKTDALFQRGPKPQLADSLRSLAVGLPAGLPAHGFHDAAAQAERGTVVDAWEDYNRAIMDLAEALRLQRHLVCADAQRDLSD